MSCIGAQLGRYRIKFKTKLGVRYEVSNGVTQTAGGQTTTLDGQTQEIIGNGLEMATDWMFGPVPLRGESYTLDVNSVSITEIPAPAPGGVPTAGGGASGGMACLIGNCAKSGGTGTAPGEGEDRLDSAAFWISLGAGDAKTSAGSISMHEAVPSEILAKPTGLKIATNPAVTTVLTNANGSITITAPTLLARLIPTNDYSYWIHCFPKVGGGYVTNGTPFVSHLLVNPNGSTNFNTLLHVRFGNGVPRTNEFLCEVNNLTNVTWRLISGNGLRGERLTKISFTNGTRLEAHTVFNPTNTNELYRRERLYWSLAHGERLLSETIDPVGLALMTTNTYDAKGRPLLTIHPDGSWERHEYAANGQRLRTVRPFGNQPPTAAASDCRVLEYGYTSVPGSGDNLTVRKGIPRTITEAFAGLVIKKTMQAFQTIPYTTSTKAFTQITADTTALWNNPDNESFTEDRNGECEVTNSISSEGTTTSSTEEATAGGGILNGGILHTSSSGVWGGTAYTAGTKSVTTVDNLGNPVSQSTFDIASAKHISGQTYSGPDMFGRPTITTYNDDSTSVSVRQDCCATSYTIDRDGVRTDFTHDALNRQIASVRLGITVSNTFDALHRRVRQTRRGTDGTPINTFFRAYDRAGRLLNEMNAVLGLTAHAYQVDANGQSITTTTLPDTTTRVETRFRDGELASTTGSAVLGARYEYGREASGPVQNTFTTEIKLDANGTDTSEWTKSVFDGHGHPIKQVFAAAAAPYPARTMAYNQRGQLTNETAPDGVRTLYAYTARGERAYTAVDSGGNGLIDFSGADRITQVTNDIVAAHGTVVQRTRTYVWGTNGSPTATLVSTHEVSTNGLGSWQTTWNGATPVEVASVTVIPASGNNWTRTVTQTAPDGSTVVSVSRLNQLQSVTRKDSAGTQMAKTTYAYDAHGRQSSVTDARNGTTTFTYANNDQVTAVTTPAPGNGGPAQTTTTVFDAMRRPVRVIQPDGTSVTNEYFPTGLLKKTSGSRTYPVEYTYDHAGRMKTMKTWRNFAAASGAAVTTWNYDSHRGWLMNKRYADNLGPDYTYTPGGRLYTRQWARTVAGNRVTTSYSYNDAGELAGVSYSDGTTPAVSYSYDRRGHRVQATRAGITTTSGYNAAGQLQSESYAGGLLNGLAVTNAYDAHLRRTALTLNLNSAALNTTAYSYDNASRLLSVSDGTNSATYSYLADSPLVQQVTFKQNGTTRLTTTKGYDRLNRLSTLNHQPSTESASSFAYQYNVANQRQVMRLADDSYWRYDYDTLGQVVSGRNYWRDGSPVEGQQFEYAFDDIGNRTGTKAGGDTGGAGLRPASYSVNDLNQYTQRDVPGMLDILGVARGTVTLNGGGGVHRHGEYFRKELAVDNSAAAQFPTITITAADGTSVTQTGRMFLARAVEVFGHDADGNLTNDGRWMLTWDAENRLVQAESFANAPEGSRVKMAFAYDDRSRRIGKTVWVWNTTLGAYLLGGDQKFLYDGWNLIGALDAGNALQLSFRWGSDLSGSLQGAGGVGGLLSMTAHTGANAGVSFVAGDANGNVTALHHAANGSVTAQYEYDPFGRLLRATGPLAFLNPFRFSTKWQDEESGWSYYGYRFYDAENGRWVSRDVIDEAGGISIFGFVQNVPVMFHDRNGRDFIGILPPFLPPGTLPAKLPDWPTPEPPNQPAIGPPGSSTPARNCGYFCTRATYPGVGQYPIIRETMDCISGACIPHAFISRSYPPVANETFSYPDGTETDANANHWTSFCDQIEVLAPNRCQDFWDCIATYDWKDDQGRYNVATRNCQTFARNAVKKCGGRIKGQPLGIPW